MPRTPGWPEIHWVNTEEVIELFSWLEDMHGLDDKSALEIDLLNLKMRVMKVCLGATPAHPLFLAFEGIFISSNINTGKESWNTFFMKNTRLLLENYKIINNLTISKFSWQMWG